MYIEITPTNNIVTFRYQTTPDYDSEVIDFTQLKQDLVVTVRLVDGVWTADHTFVQIAEAIAQGVLVRLTDETNDRYAIVGEYGNGKYTFVTNDGKTCYSYEVTDADVWSFTSAILLNIVDNLTTDDPDKALSARQGKILNETKVGATDILAPVEEVPSNYYTKSETATYVAAQTAAFITKSVNNLTNYYLKSDTYTKAEVQALIGAINQFHFEIYSSLADVTDPAGNVLYLIGPTGTGSDKYEEYVYANGQFVKIGDTSIDLSGYVTTDALNAALANYYQKPEDGIPESDLSNAVATKLNAALDNILTSLSDLLTNRTSEDKYPSAKATFDGLGKWGVVSQTQTWSGTGSNPRTYTMSDLVYGLIPQANIDLFVSAGATFNDTTGYFELNGLTDISYEEMKKIYDAGQLTAGGNSFGYRFQGKQVRTTLPFKADINTSNMPYYTATQLFNSSAVEVVALIVKYNNDIITTRLGGISYMAADCRKLRKIINPIILVDTLSTQNFSYSFSNCNSLEELSLGRIGKDVSFAQSSLLNLASVVYMVTNAANTSAITITLHATAYARCQADTTEYTYSGQTYTGILAYASARNITLASA